MTAVLPAHLVTISMVIVTLMISAPQDSCVAQTIVKDQDLTTLMIVVILVCPQILVIYAVNAELFCIDTDMNYVMANPGGMIAGVQIPNFNMGGTGETLKFEI